MDTVAVTGIDIDRHAPQVRVQGVRNGTTYTDEMPTLRCQATDRLSGVARCTVRKRTQRTATGTLVRYRVVAVDRAGNRGTATGSYRTRATYLDGAPWRGGRFQVTAGSSYRLVVSGSAVRPVYYNAELAPRRPYLRGPALHAAGHHRWAIAIRIDDDMRGRTWERRHQGRPDDADRAAVRRTVTARDNGPVTEAIAYFDRDGDLLVPQAPACSMWSDDQLHGVALSGALARAAEHQLDEVGRTDLLPARWTVDLFKPARMQPSKFNTEVVREGSRICLVDVTMTQDGQRVARASATFLKPTATAAGEVWEPAERPSPPSLDLAPPTTTARVPFFRSDNDWSQDFRQHQNAGRKASWNSSFPIVVGEPLTGFQAAAATADGGSMVTNWGSGGVEYINTDIAMTLSRRPIGIEIGLLATDRVEQDGIAVGTATVFDREGPLGTVIVAALANARRTVDLGGVEYTDDGRRTTS